jgi:hypothetical protein
VQSIPDRGGTVILNNIKETTMAIVKWLTGKVEKKWQQAGKEGTWRTLGI